MGDAANVGRPAHAIALLSTDRSRILAYCGILVLLVEFGAPYNGLIDLPITFFLKNKLHLSATGISTFRLIAAIPTYFAAVFGLARDRFNPLGMGDRGFIFVFGGLTCLLYAFMAFTPITLVSLMIGIFAIKCVYLLAAGAMRGLFGVVGQQHLMSGRLTSVWNVVLAVPLVASYFIGGYLSDLLEGQGAQAAARMLFLVGAGMMALLSLYGLWRPKFLFDNLKPERAAGSSLWSDMKRLARHRPIYPALAIWFLWEFSPGGQTVLAVYLSNTLHASDAVWGEYNAIYYASFVPTFLLFGFLCRRVPLRRLLWWGTLVAIPQMVPLLFIHSPTEALIWAVPIGLMGGVATGAYMDLLIRSCPPGLQGATLGLSVAAFWIAVRFGDLWGTELYSHHGGFPTCVWVTTAVYALILPLILLIPKGLIATRDGDILEATAT